MFQFKNWLIVNFLLIVFIGCSATLPTQPPLPTRFDPTALPRATAAPAATNPPVQNPTVLAPTPEPTSSAVLPRNAVWLLNDNAIVAANAQTQHVILTDNPETLNPIAMQVAPDGARFAYMLFDQTGRVRFFVTDAETGAQQTLAEGRNTGIVGARFSPDGKQIAYTVIDQSNPAQGKWELRVHDFETQASRVLEQFQQTSPNDSLKPLGAFAWTNAGLFVEQYLWNSDAPPQGIMRMDPQSGQMHSVTSESHLRAEISPNAQHIARVTGITPLGPDAILQTSLSILNVNDGGMKMVAQNAPNWISIVRWSPDGTRLLFSKQSNLTDSPTELVIARADGTIEQTLPIPKARGTLKDAAWRDDGTLLLLFVPDTKELHLYQAATDHWNADAWNRLAVLEGSSRPFANTRIVYVPTH